MSEDPDTCQTRPMALETRPVTLDYDDAAIADLHTRLDLARLPSAAPGEPWAYGVELDLLRDALDHWRHHYDWRPAEAMLNGWNLHECEIQGERIVFAHLRSERDDALPLLLTHGWPGSIVEFATVIDDLRAPANDADPAFHLVIPCLPGFGLSGPTVTTGVGPRRVATMWAELMAGLGYTRYGAQGGDWGAIITSHLGLVDSEHLVGIHINMVTAPPNEELMADMTPAEQAVLGDLLHFQTHETGYQAIQGTKPQTLAVGLTDSPVGLCAWILEKFWTWTDHGDDLWADVDKDTFCTNLMLYWLTDTVGSAARIYHEFQQAEQRQLAVGVEVPTAGAIFPNEIYRTSRRWAEARYNIVHWSEFDRGGHFAAVEEPDLLVRDIRSFFGSLDTPS